MFGESYSLDGKYAPARYEPRQGRGGENVKKKSYHSLCTVLRTVKVAEETVNMVTGKRGKARTWIETKACGTPLFGAPESLTGICLSCARGWSVEDNRFASEKERERAASEGKS
jgi:hypothetical protein